MQMFPTSHAGAAKLHVSLMLISFAAVAAFLFWLFNYAAPEEDALTAGDTATSVTTVPYADFAVDPAAHFGTTIRIRDLGVSQVINTRLLFVPMGADPYMVFLTEAALADSVEVTTAAPIDVRGSVMEFSDSVLVAWSMAGIFEERGDSALAAFAAGHGTYFEVVGFGAGDGMDEPGEGDGTDSEGDESGEESDDPSDPPA